jgi:hypothetical protein
MRRSQRRSLPAATLAPTMISTEVDLGDLFRTSVRHNLATAVTVVSLASMSVSGQSATGVAKLKKTAATKAWTPPRTADGQPDLQGIWLSNGATPLERPKTLEGRELLTDEEVAELKKRVARFRQNGSDFAGGDNYFLGALSGVDQYKAATATEGFEGTVEKEFDNRTALIIDPSDGRIPPLTLEAQQRQAERAEATRRSPADGPENRNLIERCITGGVPRLGGNFGSGPYSYYQILQTAGYVALYMEMYHDVRIIPVDGRPHLPQSIRNWNGDSRGRWDGNTLVVDTTNFATKSNFMGSAEHLHLLERFTRVAPDTISYEITLDDPTTWTKSWTAVVRLKQTRDKIYESACHEGNDYVMHGILAGARAEEKAAEEAAKKGSRLRR